ncbi:MAG: hypothetical protein HY742_09055 [Deltaproteobacteria bacterium]|nr:hypothetical protein [Deltaproteobacteria bacterium]
MTETYQFALKYDGESFRTHEMDARDLAPALIGLCDLVDEANRTLNAGRSRIDIKVRTLRDGSFQIDVTLIQSIVDQTVDLLSGKSVTALIALVTLLGLGRGAYIGLIELIRRLKGLAPRAVKDLGEGKVEILLEDGQALQIHKETLIVYQSRKAREAAHRVVKPLEREGVDTVDILHNTEIIQRVTKDEAKYFEPIFEETRRVTDRHTRLSIQALWFRGDNKWRFMERDSPISATIDDQAFIERILKEDEPFQPSDQLEVVLQQTETTTPQGDLKVEYSVKEVLNHIRVPKQQRLGL